MSTGKIGSADLAANADTLLGAVDENMVVNVLVTNRNNAAVKVRIAIGPNAGVAPAAADFIEYDADVQARSPLEKTGLALSTGEKIWVRSDTANVSARAHGIPAA